MNVLMIGSGAREHTLAHALSHNPETRVHCIGSGTNPGIRSIASTYVSGDILSPREVVRYARETGADHAVVGPEAPLAAGVADALLEIGVPVFGPAASLARIETSKAYARSLMRDYQIPGLPRFRHFDTLDGVAEFLAELGDGFVVKADGLMGGKGVKVAGEHLQDHREALGYAEELIHGGGSFVLEEKCVGPEFSVFTLSDGKSVVHLPPVQDHKRAGIGDTGPNTGGMGSYTDADHRLPFLTAKDIRTAESINEATLDALHRANHRPYQGVLYGGFMATADGVRVIEFNSRFGDPEVMNLIALLRTDFSDLVAACLRGHLERVRVDLHPLASVCKYLVPIGYPDRPEKGFPVDTGGLTADHGCFLGAVDLVGGTLVGTGSRTVAIVATGRSIADAEQAVEERITRVQGDLIHRPDIGTAPLIAKRVDLIHQLRANAN